MMVRGLQVSSFSGESPTSKQYMLRSVGSGRRRQARYFRGTLGLSGTKMSLTWHDRLSRTYLTSPEILAESDAAHAAAAR